MTDKLDATNSTFERRRWIRERIEKEPTLQLLFLESFCDDPAIIATNVALKVQSGDPDYKDMTKAKAEADFRKRIAAYESVYDTISEPDLSYCRIMNVGRQVTINRIQGYLQSRIAFYLMNLHLKPRNIYLSRVSWTVCFSQIPEAEIPSMENQCTTSADRSVVIRICHLGVGNTPKPYLHSSRRMSARMQILRSASFFGPSKAVKADISGLDFHLTADNADRLIPQLPEEDLEIS